MAEDLKGKISDMAGSIAPDFGMHVVDVELAGSVRRPTVRIFVDKQGGVTLDDCAEFSRAMSALLDVEDPIRTRYVLEVSSPGLDRPLRRLEDFEQSVGKLARVITRESVADQNFFVGRIAAVEEGIVRLTVEKKGEIDIPFDNISKARLEIELK
jgi:ribosome maturation factor RimP